MPHVRSQDSAWAFSELGHPVASASVLGDNTFLIRGTLSQLPKSDENKAVIL